ncbi:MAG TPA: CotH kinase family protein [Bacillota bacterium]|nr:CotH kinase family protein [Bacillota bacterium]
MHHKGISSIGKIAIVALLVIFSMGSFNLERVGAIDSKAYPPVLSHDSGWYGEEFLLTLSTKEEGAVIYYTLDGSIPDEGSLRYESPISIGNRTNEPNNLSEIQTAPHGNKPRTNVFKGNVIRARVFKQGYEASEPVTRTYFVDKELSDRYIFPVVSIVCDPDDLFGYERGIYVPGKIYDDNYEPWKEDYERDGNYSQRGRQWERPAYVEFFETDGSTAFALNAGVRIHGGASRATIQKTLRIYARSEYDAQNRMEHEIFPGATKYDGSPLTRYKRLLFRNGGNDFWDSYFRDAFMQDLVFHTGLDMQSSRPVIIFINGEYWGIQNARDRIDDHYISNKYDVDRNRVAILEGDGWLTEGVSGDEAHYKGMIEYIKRNNISENEHYEYINTQMDVDNFIDYQISQIYFANDDWPGNNIKFWRVRTDEYIEDAGRLDGRWRWIVYDVDFGFGLYKGNDGHNHQTLSLAMEAGRSDWPNPDWSTFLLRSLMENDEFKTSFVSGFADHLNSSFSPARVLAKINDFENLYKPEIEEHIYRWNTMGSINDWQHRVNVLANFAQNRPGAMYSQLNNVLKLKGTSRLTLDCNDDKGYIQVNNVHIKKDEVGIADMPYPWTGMYFNEFPVTISAHPYEGSSFTGWEGDVPEEVKDELEITLRLDQAISLTATFDGAGGLGSDTEPKEQEEGPLLDMKGLVFLVPLGLLVLFGGVLILVRKRAKNKA